MAVASSFSEIVIQKNDKETLVFLYRGWGWRRGNFFVNASLNTWLIEIHWYFLLVGGTNITCSTKKYKQKKIFKDLNTILMINPFVMFYFSNSVIPYTKTAKVKLKPCKVDIHCIMKCINFVSQIKLRYLPQQLYLFCLYCQQWSSFILWDNMWLWQWRYFKYLNFILNAMWRDRLLGCIPCREIAYRPIFFYALICSLHYFRFSLPSLQFNLTSVLVSTDGRVDSMRLFDA